jgi:hypothetical protein
MTSRWLTLARQQGVGAIPTQQDPAEQGLLQLIYVSDAAASLRQPDLDDIAARSQNNNERLGLTGFLLYQRPRFYALLEGTRSRLFARMEVIVTDPRHSTLRILHEVAIRSRRFSNWSFGMLPHGAQEFGNGSVPDEFLKTLSRRL